MAPAVASPTTALGYQASLADLYPSPLNPRKHFDDLDDLAANIRVHGVLVPLLVRSRPDQVGLEIVDGERRYRAAQLAGNVDALPVVERDLEDDEVLEIQLLSAIQRQALTPLEEARGYRRLIDSNRAKYSAAYIADRIGRSEKYVVDRMRLSQLIPALQELLDAERIGVAHAELLAKLKPEDQERASHPGNDAKFGRAGDPGGLWQRTGATLAFGEDEDRTTDADPYAGLKPRTVKELEAWIARHVRFDVEHFAQTAPLDFGDTAIAVEAATQQPGRGKKVIQITEDYRIDDDVKDPTQRVYGRQSWKRADGTDGTSRGGRYGETRVDSSTCEHSVLGVVTVGPGYGTAYQVCIARDKCTVHWAKEIKEREKNAKLRAKGQGSKADAREKKAAETHKQRWKREAAERKARQDAWAAVWKHLRPEVVRQAKAVTALTPAQVAHFEKQALALEITIDPDVCRTHGLTWWKNLPAALVLSEVIHGEDADDFPDFTKTYGPLLNLKPLEAIIRDTQAPATAPAKPKSAAKPAPKAKAGKAAKKR